MNKFRPTEDVINMIGNIASIVNQNKVQEYFNLYIIYNNESSYYRW